MSDDARFMALALSLGRRGQGAVWPNPAVGCVIVQQGRIVGRGWTQPGGRPHAEPQALRQAGPAAQGATVYVTLEPCAHTGKTPPCADALVAAKPARVVIACTDSDPRVSGKGIAILRAAGIIVDVGVLENVARADHLGFFLRVDEGRPMVTLKLASSFDGRIATASGESQWITAPPARRVVHAMRSRHDAVMVGGGTARQDDPSLTVRDLGTTRQPTRIVVSNGLDIPLNGTLARTANDIPLILCHGPKAPAELIETWESLGATLISCAPKMGQIDADDMLQQLGRHGLTRIFCEGGGGLAATLLKADLVDQLVGFTAGLALGADGLPAIAPLQLQRLAQAPRFTLTETSRIGPDLLHIWARGNTPA
ncbi:bifunctional diaminohydroxyphosphoribosylaminopyrimidine deaminase/5-amino-6-(5-phosphoribosylamino)uracil reductase RibD [Sulfitobacter pontiacus]|uniref:bifunctional diaminohydroxyphosphoribosylaminopyrimidine deaminase/5-amino-6-(5-phosphoribosylamino)uracil reductase RibD n=1 Tax=Sulfitobacter pontiacus TaxID=60137 RepID=UPI000447EB88|nr:bifunctional diaminohydroxyphosphoribosylaminopyrimidine deaminase/5-amino-6-(5-phosphoribosylamino)uracil reductase RibD [Sulfitobacter pontiacus]KAJ31083.1 5-amino-6-(5-phosphoribosylamino)uracil reductase [Sulfitobacter pontiacus 3SOLIMAR09]